MMGNLGNNANLVTYYFQALFVCVPGGSHQINLNRSYLPEGAEKSEL